MQHVLNSHFTKNKICSNLSDLLSQPLALTMTLINWNTKTTLHNYIILATSVVFILYMHHISFFGSKHPSNRRKGGVHAPFALQTAESQSGSGWDPLSQRTKHKHFPSILKLPYRRKSLCKWSEWWCVGKKWASCMSWDFNLNTCLEIALRSRQKCNLYNTLT